MDPPIVRVIQHYFPDFEPPEDTGREWVKCLCPFHGDGVASAGISYQNNAFRCMACPVRGGPAGVIATHEEVSFAAAVRKSAELLEGCDGAVPQGPTRKPRRRVFGDKGFDVPEHSGGGRAVHAGIRGRATPWS